MSGIKQIETTQNRLKTTTSGRQQTVVVELPFGLNYLNNNFVSLFARALDRCVCQYYSTIEIMHVHEMDISTNFKACVVLKRKQSTSTRRK